jgi:hypothetical protein
MNAPFPAETADAAELVADKALIDLDARFAFLQRAAVRCSLVECGALSLDEGVGELIEPFMAIVSPPPECPTCGAAPCASPSFCRICREADGRQKPTDERTKFLRKLLDPNVGLDKARRLLNDRRPTPEATVEAILYSVRERGVAALKEPANVDRLSRCDQAALAEIDRRVAKLKDVP